MPGSLDCSELNWYRDMDEFEFPTCVTGITVCILYLDGSASRHHCIPAWYYDMKLCSTRILTSRWTCSFMGPVLTYLSPVTPWPRWLLLLPRICDDSSCHSQSYSSWFIMQWWLCSPKVIFVTAILVRSLTFVKSKSANCKEQRVLREGPGWRSCAQLV